MLKHCRMCSFLLCLFFFFFFSSRRRHTRLQGDWSSDVCSSDLSGHVDDGGYPLVRQRFPGLVAALEPPKKDLLLLQRADDGGEVQGQAALLLLEDPLRAPQQHGDEEDRKGKHSKQYPVLPACGACDLAERGVGHGRLACLGQVGLPWCRGSDASIRANSLAGTAADSRYPCTQSQPMLRSNSRSWVVSTPSAVTVRPSCRPSCTDDVRDRKSVV